MDFVREIEETITHIKTHHPDLYKDLDRSPIHTRSGDNVAREDLKKYLEYLKQKIERHKAKL